LLSSSKFFCSDGALAGGGREREGGREIRIRRREERDRQRTGSDQDKDVLSRETGPHFRSVTLTTPGLINAPHSGPPPQGELQE
jgi:hypothetical protein